MANPNFSDQKSTLKLTMYADDLTVYLAGDEQSLRNVMKILNDFYSLSGLKINLSKTKAVWFGSSWNSDQILCPDIDLEWCREFELLGTKFDSNLVNMDDNYEIKMTAIEKLLHQWLYRHLTPFGRICIIKSLALN